MYKLQYFPNSNLRRIASEVKEFNQELCDTAEEMYKIMKANDGIGLAGNQVNFLKRLIVVDLSDSSYDYNGDDGPLYLVNPIITEFGTELDTLEEGCLSIPGQLGNVDRPTNISLSYCDLSGKKHNLNASGILSRCIQHEVDHLNGKLFIDRMSAVHKDIITRKIHKLSKQGLYPHNKSA